MLRHIMVHILFVPIDLINYNIIYLVLIIVIIVEKVAEKTFVQRIRV